MPPLHPEFYFYSPEGNIFLGIYSLVPISIHPQPLTVALIVVIARNPSFDSRKLSKKFDLPMIFNPFSDRSRLLFRKIFKQDPVLHNYPPEGGG